MEPSHTTTTDKTYFEYLDTNDPQSVDTMATTTMMSTWWPPPTTQNFMDETQENGDQEMYTHNMSSENTTYCVESWGNFWSTNFDPWVIHTTILPIICFLACLTNIITIMVLTRKRMGEDYTNKILAAIALADLLVVAEEFILTLVYRFDDHKWWRVGSEDGDEVSNIIFTLWILIVLFHTWTIYLTLATAVWRWFGHVQPSNFGGDWFTCRGVNWTILAGFLVGTLAFAPFFFLHFASSTLHHSLAQARGLVYAIFIKLIPCLLLTILTVSLIRFLQNAKQLRQLENSPLSNIWSLNGPNVFEPVQKNLDKKDNKKVAQTDKEKAEKELEKVTKILIVIFIIFILTELLPGLSVFVEVLAGKNFYGQCQRPVVPILNLIQFLRTWSLFLILLGLSPSFRACLAQLVRRVVPSHSLQISATTNGGAPPVAVAVAANGVSGGGDGEKTTTIELDTK